MQNININIDWNSFQGALNQLMVRLTQLTGMDVIFVILALLLPPVAVFLKVGLTSQFWFNVVLTILGVLPGQIHALWVVLFLH